MWGIFRLKSLFSTAAKVFGTIVVTEGAQKLFEIATASSAGADQATEDLGRQYALNVIYANDGLGGLKAFYNAGLISRMEVAVFLVREMSMYDPALGDAFAANLESKARETVTAPAWYESILASAPTVDSLSSDPSSYRKMLFFLHNSLK